MPKKPIEGISPARFDLGGNYYYHTWCKRCNSNHHIPNSTCNPTQLAWWVARRAEMKAEEELYEREHKALKALEPILDMFGLEMDFSEDFKTSCSIRFKKGFIL